MELDITISQRQQRQRERERVRAKRSEPNALSAAIVRLYLLQHVSLYLRPNIKVEQTDPHVGSSTCDGSLCVCVSEIRLL